MILTPSQIDEVMSMIDNYFGVFIGHNISTNVLTADQLNTLVNAGININSINVVDQAFKFGMLSDMLGDAAAKAMNYDQFKIFLKDGTKIPLNQFEKQAILSLERQIANDVQKLQSRIKGNIQEKLVFADKELNTVFHDKVVVDAAKQAVLKRKSVTSVVSEIGEMTGEWTRDLGRIADFVLHTAFDEGRAAQFEKTAGGETLVYKVPYPQAACNHCIKLYLTSGYGSQPIVFKISQLRANGTNVGRKVADWKAVVGGVHPYCFDKETDVLTRDGWKNWTNVSGDEEFLSVDPITGKSEWVKAISLIKYKYKGKMDFFKGHAFNLMTTPNHMHFLKSKKSKTYFGMLVPGKDLTKSSFFVNISKNSWTGFSPKIKAIGDIDVPFNLYCKFMGWFLSEGSCFKLKNRNTYVLDISQEKLQNLDEIKNLFIEIFGKNTRNSNGHVGVYINRQIYDFFKQFGHSYNKFIPEDIKNASKEDISAFMLSFRKGDGSIIKKSNNYINSKESTVYFTSSNKLASDLGEMIIKMDGRPSYFFTEPKEVCHKNGNYTSKYGIWSIYHNRSKTSILKRMNRTEVDYDDYVYDVELEKFHTLYVRRGGKVTISGNCRCSLIKAPTLMNLTDLASGIWEWNGDVFVQVKREAKTNNTIKVTVNGKTTEVAI